MIDELYAQQKVRSLTHDYNVLRDHFDDPNYEDGDCSLAVVLIEDAQVMLSRLPPEDRARWSKWAVDGAEFFCLNMISFWTSSGRRYEFSECSQSIQDAVLVMLNLERAIEYRNRLNSSC